MIKKIKILAFSFFIILTPFYCFSQFTISGRILNKADAKPVGNASVFLSNATKGGATTEKGTFTLSNIMPGKYELVVSIVGFETYSRTVPVSDSDVVLPDIFLVAKTITLQEVAIKVDRKKEKNFSLLYDLFKSEFFGPSEFAGYCKILNPELLDLNYDDASNTLTGSSVDFLNIENEALGYKIRYLLTSFVFASNTGEIHYEGPALFKEMKGTPAEEHRWQQNRKQAYEGSMIHLVRSAMDDRLQEEGFRVLRLSAYANPQRPCDSVIKAKLKKFDVKKNAPVYNGDSLSYWKKKDELPKTIHKLIPSPLKKDDIISRTQEPGIFALDGHSDELLVDFNKNHHFTEMRSLADLANLDYILNKGANKDLSLLHFKTPYTFFDNNGRIMNPNSLEFKGALGKRKIAELLPIDYEALQKNIVFADSVVKSIENKINTFTTAQITEKVHLHLDRPWYGLGDTIWFKAYTVAGPEHKLSGLSGVLYAELINPKDSITSRLILPVDSGISQGNFIVPYNYKNGTYRLRAYTKLMLNDSAYFYDQNIIIGGINPVTGQILPEGTKPDLLASNNLPQHRPQNPDVQFFPEGGYLINGLRSKVAVKVINRAGQGEDSQGVITDQDGNEVSSFSTQHAGMGQFPLTPQANKLYKANITTANGNNFTVDLPEAKDTGFTLTINNAVDSIFIKVATNEAFYKNNQNSTFYLVAQSGGKLYYTGSSKLTRPIFTTMIDKARFPSGILQFTLVSQSGEPLNERIIFIQNPDQLKLAVATEKQSHSPLQKMKIDLQAKNSDDKAADGTFSVSVTDETKVPIDETSESTIFTDLLLTSELKGNIENPNYYFVGQNDKTRTDLDLLMLTQGYRRFEWKKMLANNLTSSVYQPEITLSLSGRIATASNKPIANGRIRLTSIKDQFVMDTLSDTKGNFTFSNLYFNDSTKLIIDAKKANGNDHVNINIKESTYPPVKSTKSMTNSYLRTGTPEQVLLALKKAYITGQQDQMKNVIQLKEVKIKDRRNEFFNPVYTDNMRFSSNLNGPGNANQVILGDKLTEGGGGKLSDLLPGKTFGLTWRGGIPYSLRATHIGGGSPMTIFIEGAQVSPNNLDAINPFDIYSIEILTSISYLSIYGSNAPGGALIITMKHGAGPVDLSKIAVDGLITYKFKGFYKAREFYSPKYNIKDTARVTDDRKTIYWNPNIITDANGKASFEYFNAGSPGTYRVVVEGIDADGNLGRQVFRYKVE